MREGIGRLWAELDRSQWIRVGRSAILNIDRIRELRSWFAGDYVVVMKDGYREELQVLMGRRG